MASAKLEAVPSPSLGPPSPFSFEVDPSTGVKMKNLKKRNFIVEIELDGDDDDDDDDKEEEEVKEEKKDVAATATAIIQDQERPTTPSAAEDTALSEAKPTQSPTPTTPPVKSIDTTKSSFSIPSPTSTPYPAFSNTSKPICASDLSPPPPSLLVSLPTTVSYDLRLCLYLTVSLGYVVASEPEHAHADTDAQKFFLSKPNVDMVNLMMT